MSRVIAHGVDLVEVERIKRSLDEHGERFVMRCFTNAEADYCRSARPPRDIERFAARFAAKEAALKALGTGWADGIAWTDAEVVLAPSGAPSVRLVGKAEKLAQELGITEMLISLSHTSTNAMASVIAVGD